MNQLIQSLIIGVVSAFAGAGGASWYLAWKGAPQRAASLAETAATVMQSIIDTLKEQNEALLKANERLQKLNDGYVEEIKKVLGRLHIYELDNQRLKFEYLAVTKKSI